jgi:formate-dependent nitrite reductase membrane component NrfD
MEITITGTNTITYPHMHIWDWRIAAYLFLGGLTAGALVMSAVANLRKSKNEPRDRACCIKVPLISPFILSVGMIFIFFDLERKLNSFWFYLSFQPLSPMSWGAWGVGLIIPLSFLYGLSTVPDELREMLRFGFLKRLSARLYPHMRRLAALNFVLGIFLGIYTGVLLSAFVARPLWNSAILPILFLNSALSTGAALVIIMARRNEVKLFFTKVDIWLIFAEITVLALFFYGHYTSSEVHREAIMPFFTFSHEFFPYWMSIFTLSIIFPLALVLKFLETKTDVSGSLTGAEKFRMNLSALLVLVGGLIIRLAVVYAGQLSGFSELVSHLK